MPRLMYIVTHPATANGSLRGQLAFMREQGFEVVLVCAPGSCVEDMARREGVRVITVPMHREIHLWHDCISLIRLWHITRSVRPDIVNAGTPKAGLLGMIAAKLARVRVRIYTLKGLRLETARGIKKWVLRHCERTAAGCSHRVVCVGESLRQAAIEQGLVRESKAVVLGAGSSNGIGPRSFLVPPVEESTSLREQLAIPDGAPVIGFSGRFVRDKGIVELLNAYERILQSHPNARLLMIGEFEEGDPLPADCVHRMKSHPQILLPGFVNDPRRYYAMMDVFAFPSYREGLPKAPLEAAAQGVPTVGFKATGVIDAVRDGLTGSLVPLKNAAALAAELCEYLDNPQLRIACGRAARAWVEQQYDQNKVWNALQEEYMRLQNMTARPPSDAPSSSPRGAVGGTRIGNRPNPPPPARAA